MAWVLEAVERAAERGFAALAAPLAISPLPPEPDRALVEAFLVETTLAHLCDDRHRTE